MSTGKKGKKAKGKAVPLQDFLALTGDSSNGTTLAVPAKRALGMGWGEADDDDDANMPTQFIQLPTGPRASRVYDDESLPNKPPFIAYLTNLPFDLTQEDLADFFDGLSIVNIRLPREDGGTRSRGYGHVEFETRDDLLDAISMPNPTIQNRYIRMDVNNENDQRRQQRPGGRFGDRDRDRESTSAGDTNWRRGGPGPSTDSGRGGEGGYRPRFSSSQAGGGSSRPDSDWRSDRRPMDDDSRDGPRERYGGRRSNYEERSGGGGGWMDRREAPSQPTEGRERPRLNLQPRTLPVEEIVVTKSEPAEQEERPESPVVERPKPLPSAQIFGSAKPVDTAAREREIEERLAKEAAEQREQEEEERRQRREAAEAAEKNAASEEEPEKVDENSEEGGGGGKKQEVRSWRRQTGDEEEQGQQQQRGPSGRWNNDERRGDRDGDRRGDRDRRGIERDGDRRGDRDRRGDYDGDRRGGGHRDDRRSDYGQRNDRRGDRNDRPPMRRENEEYNEPRRGDDWRGEDGMRRRGGENDSQPRDNHRQNNGSMDPEEEQRRLSEKMPKYKPPEGPNLSMSNKYAAFLDEEGDE